MIKKVILLILTLASTVSFSQDKNTNNSSQSNKLFIKAYGGISPLLSDDFKITTPSQTSFIREYEYDVGYNIGISAGYFVLENIAIQIGFENKTNRLFMRTLSFNSSFSFDFSSKVNSNMIYFNGLYYFKNTKHLKPYFGLGGSILQDITHEIISADFMNSGNIGIRGIFGVDYSINKSLLLNFEVSYNYFGEIDLEDGIGTVINLEYNPLTLNLGLIYAFNL